GQVVYVAPLLFLAAGMALAFDYRRATNVQMVLGVTGLLVMLFGWLHLSTTLGGAFDSTGARLHALMAHRPLPPVGRVPDGGLFGALIMSVMFPLGQLGAYVTLGAIGAASVLLISELTLRGIVARI